MLYLIWSKTTLNDFKVGDYLFKNIGNEFDHILKGILFTQENHVSEFTNSYHPSLTSLAFTTQTNENDCI